MPAHDVIVVGAGASGLGVAAALSERGRAPVLLDADGAVGGTWARRYERLHLHTVRRFSGLPFHPIPPDWPRYVPRDRYARYLSEYADRFRLDVRFGERVERIEPSGTEWRIRTASGSWTARVVVVATGRHNVPKLPQWRGMEAFEGRLLHSHDYSTGREFAGARVLVIGIGNSGAEIAADLVECGASHVAISVRTSPPITSREIAGIPVQLFGMALSPFPASLVDGLGKLVRRIGTGDLRKYGLGDEAWGPFTARRPPVIDVGFLEKLKAGRVEIVPDVERFTKGGVEFVGGRRAAFDAVVAATGYSTGLPSIIAAPGALDERGFPRAGAPAPGLYFAGFAETPRGQLFESNRAARPLAAAIDRYLTREAPVRRGEPSWPRR